jgi:hypothetical protein
MQSPTHASPPVAAKRSLLWPIVVCVVLAGGVLALALWLGRGTAAGSQEAMLVVFVRPSRGSEPVQVDAAGALPVRDGGSMNLEAQHRQAVCSYLVWLDSSSRGVPLYPWNNAKLEVTDLSAPPPVRRPGKVVQSPNSFGGSWEFAPGSGIETVLLLSRAQPLEEGANVARLMGDLPPPVAVRDPKELVVMEVRGHAKEVTTLVSRDRGDEAAAQAADEPLKALLLRLSPHFDLVRAVRFAHVAEEAQEEGKK